MHFILLDNGRPQKASKANNNDNKHTKDPLSTCLTSRAAKEIPHKTLEWAFKFFDFISSLH
jgi:hypothetical protein